MSSSRLGPRSVKTCTECKQAKLRCDSREKFPNPCSRCHARQLFCTVDAGFRRTPARKRLEAMNRELQELRSQREGDNSSARTEPAAESVPSVVEEGEDDFEISSPFQASLEGEVLDADMVTEAFRRFANDLRPQLPIIGPLSINKTYQKRPLMFWTIIIIIAAHLPDDRWVQVLHRLEEPYVRFLREQILTAPLPLYRIQALLLLCHWPLKCAKQTRDPSWLYCGTAIHAARFMSLDRQQSIPSLQSIGVASGSIQTRINTWLGCFYVSTTLGIYLGLPPPIESDLDFVSINSFLRRQTVPPLFALQVKVQLVVAKFTSLLNHEMSNGASSSFIRLLDSELGVLKAEAALDSAQMATLELDILSARMHLYALIITKGATTSPNRQIMLKTALDIGLKIIHISTLELRSSPSGKEDFALIQRQRCLPKNHYRSLAFATIFLIKFFLHRPSDDHDERQAVVNHIAMTLDLFKTYAVEPEDEYHRTARIFEVLGGQHSAYSETSQLRLTHRMGVSIVYDAVTNASEVRGEAVDVSEDEAVEDTSQPPTSHEEAALNLEFDETSSWSQDNSSAEFPWGFWNDPFLSMLNMQPNSLEEQYPSFMQSM